MTTRKAIIEYCLTFPAAYEDYPFAELPGDGETTVMRHRTNKKSFTDKLSCFSPAHENFIKMPRSAKAAYVRRFLSFKKEETRQNDFEKIVDMLNQKPTISGNR